MVVFRNVLKAVSWTLTLNQSGEERDLVVLMYHRVTGDVPLELDIQYAHFCSQMRWLAARERVVSLDEGLELLQGSRELADDRCAFVVTFDDAYEDFYTRVFPLLKELDLPATLYVPTGFLDNPDIPPISRSVREGYRLQPMGWSMLEEVARSRLVTIGAHTHSHRELPSLSDREIDEELGRSDDLLKERLGVVPQHFAYPRGAWDRRVEQLIRRRYRSAALVGGGAISRSDPDPFRLSRVPVLRSDSMRWFGSRIRGRLQYEERMVWAIKQLTRQRAASFGY